MSNFIVGMCIYNEEHRFLRKCLENMRQITNTLIIIDDASTDNSYSIAKEYTSYVFQTKRLYATNESSLREILWNKCCEFAKNGDYIFINDADEILTLNSILHFQEELENAIKINAEAISIKRYDMWNETQYRGGPFWGDDTSSIRCARYNKNKKYLWTGKKIHGGSIPINSYSTVYYSKLQIQHWAYSTLELRQEKVNFYKKYDPDAKYMNNGLYDTILDKNPILIDFKDNFEDINE